MKILVLGLGNDLYGDDGVGLEAVRLLRESWAKGAEGPGGAEISFVECALSGAALLDVLIGYDALLIIDTIIRDHPETGRAHVLDAADIRDVPGPSPHYISVPQTLAMGARLGLRVPKTAKVLGVEAKGLYRLGEGLSPEMRGRIPDILEAARIAIRALRDCP